MKLCTVCGVVTSRAGSRCTTHARQSNRSRHNALYGTRAWQASLGSGPRPVAIDRARIDRQIRDLALVGATTTAQLVWILAARLRGPDGEAVLSRSIDSIGAEREDGIL